MKKLVILMSMGFFFLVANDSFGQCYEWKRNSNGTSYRVRKPCPTTTKQKAQLKRAGVGQNKQKSTTGAGRPPKNVNNSSRKSGKAIGI